VPDGGAYPTQARETPAFAAPLWRMRSHSAAIAFHRCQLLNRVHAIRWKPPPSAIQLTDSRFLQRLLNFCNLFLTFL
jgi:hypothetical protein